MSSLYGKSISYAVIALFLTSLIFLLAPGAAAQKESPQDRDLPPLTAPKEPAPLETAPPPPPPPTREKATEQRFRGRQEQGLELKKSSERIGGHEVPQKKEPKDQ